MIDKDDKKTQDAFGQKRRGRPPTGKALTPAERKSLQRARTSLSVREVRFGNAKPADISLTALYKELQTAVRYGDMDLFKICTKELQKRLLHNQSLH